MDLLPLVEHLQGLTLISVVILLTVGAISTAFGFAWLGGKLIESSARQPEVAAMLQTRVFIIAGLLDAVAMISVGIALYLLFANPFVQPLLDVAAQVKGVA